MIAAPCHSGRVLFLSIFIHNDSMIKKVRSISGGDIEVLYEDETVLVINKPAGMAVHQDSEGRLKNTVADWVMEKYPKMKNVGEPLDDDETILRPGIVHRLDKDTSGVLLLTKNQVAYKFLKRQFQEKVIKKVYLALIYGDLKKESGIIDRPIGRSKHDFRAKATGSTAQGEIRNAVTYYKVIKKYDGYSLLEVRPVTGRTHQIRVHLKSISHPIVCDPVYAPSKECIPGLKRQALHAMSIEFKTPEGKMVLVSAPVPIDLKRALANLKQL